MYKINTFQYMMEFESGELTTKNVLKLFCNLIENGQAFRLQGFYGRQAMDFLDQGFIVKKGGHYRINYQALSDI